MISPEKLGRYEILGELGKGAMGVVYLARDPIIDRQLAIKTFRMAYSAKEKEVEQFRQRFLREAQTVGKLSHPNIVTVHDVGQEEDEYFIAMEYIKGIDLKQQMQRGEKLDLDYIVEVVAQIGDGLACAHEQGVVHRDVKPANIIITADNQAKITDFGIARIEQSNLTVAGQLLGTPNYMAPEQIQGKDVDSRTDIFSLGVMLYELITHKKPFQGENLTQVSHRIVYDEYVSPDEYVKDLPPMLLQVLEKALRKDPDERYQDAAEMARDLRTILYPEGASAIGVPAYNPATAGSAVGIPAHPGTPATGTPAAAPDAVPPPPVVPSLPPPPAAPVSPPAAPASPPAAKSAGGGPALQEIPADLLEDTDQRKPGARAPATVPPPQSGTGPMQKPPVQPPPDVRQGRPDAPKREPPKQADRSGQKPAARPPRPRSSASKAPDDNRQAFLTLLVILLVAVVGIGLIYFGWTWSREAGPRGDGSEPPAEDAPIATPETPGAEAPGPEAGTAAVSAAETTAAQQAAQRDADLLAEARRLVNGGDTPGALAALKAGFNGLNGRKVLTTYLDLASSTDRDVSAVDAYVGERIEIVVTLLQEQKYEEASDVVDLILAADPNHEQARQWFADINNRLQRDRNPPPVRANSRRPTAPPPRPTAPPPPPSTAQVRTGTLQLAFSTMVKTGKVTVTANGRQIWQQSFDFPNSKMFKPRFLKEAETINAQKTVNAGTVQVEVVVELQLKDGPQVLRRNAGGQLATNTTKTLRISVNDDAQLSVQLQ